MITLISALFLVTHQLSTQKPQGSEFLIRASRQVPIERLAAIIKPFGRIESRKRGTSVFHIELRPGVDEQNAKARFAKIAGVHTLTSYEEQVVMHDARPFNGERDSDRGGDPDTDSPGEAIKWRHLAWVDENGKIAPGAMKRALDQKHQLSLRAHAMITGDKWLEQGPANLSGRSRCLAIDPANPAQMWQGTAGGGIWHSLDGGKSWTEVGDQLPSLAVCALVLDPNDHTTLYAGTGEGLFNIDRVSGLGIYKSTDGGTTWTQLPGTATWLWKNINRIAICPGNSNLILVTNQYGGVYRSTDGGNTFTNPFPSQSAHAIAFCPSNPSRVIGTIQDYDNGANNWYEAAIYSNDYGATWSKATGPLSYVSGFGRIETCPVPNDANTIYASASDGYIYKSTDGGKSYAKVTASGQAQGNWYCSYLWIDPTNPSRLIIAGTNVFESTDGGVTLSQISSGYIQTDQAHPDVHFFIPAPGYDGVSNKTLYACTDGGLYVAQDITTASTSSGWAQLNKNARSSQYYSVAGDGPSGRIVGGLQDNGTQSNAIGNDQSFFIFGGDGGFVAIDSANPTYIYGEYIYLEMFRNDDGGTGGNSNWIDGNLPDAGTHANFIAPFILDPNNSQVLLAGGASLWRSTDPRDPNPSFSAIRQPGSSLLSAIAVAPGDSDVIWVGQNDGGIAMTTNGTATSPTWTTISGASGPLPARYVTTILIDPDNSKVVYVTLGGFTSNNVWKTTDQGATWTSITGTGNAMLPQVPVRAIARRPGAPNILYVGTEIGVFSSFDGGKTWSTSSDMPANVSVDQLTYMNHSSTLLAATHGRGVWALNYVTDNVQGVTFNPATVVGGTSTTGTLTLAVPAPPGGILVTLSSKTPGVSVPVSVVVPAGSSTATFNVTTSPVATATTATISANRDSSTATGTLTLSPPSVSALSLSPASVVGGNDSTGTVTLTGQAPAGGFSVNLSSNSSFAIVSTSVTVPAGSATGSFTVATGAVAKTSQAAITATQGSSTQTATLTVNPATLSGLSFQPNSVVGGNSVTGTVSLNGAASTGGIAVALKSAGTGVVVPASVKVLSGAYLVNFTATTKPVTSSSTVVVTATSGTLTQKASVTLGPNALQGLSLTPSSVVGGSSTQVKGTITFNGPAPATGEKVILKCSNTAVATVPASVTLVNGSTTVTFAVTHRLVNTIQTVTITATYSGVTKTANLAVNPFQLASLAVSPTTVKGSSTTAVVGAVTISAPAPTGGVKIALASSTTSVATVPASVTVPAGKTSVTFKVTHKKVSIQTEVTLTSKLSNATLSTTLVVTP